MCLGKTMLTECAQVSLERYVVAMKCCISPAQDSPQRLPPRLTQCSAPHSLTERGALVQGWCNKCIAFPHYTETTVCQPGPLQHLNTDKTDSNTICPVWWTNHKILGFLYSWQFRQWTQNTWHGMKMQAWHVTVMGNEANSKQDMLTHTHTLH